MKRLLTILIALGVVILLVGIILMFGTYRYSRQARLLLETIIEEQRRQGAETGDLIASVRGDIELVRGQVGTVHEKLDTVRDMLSKASVNIGSANKMLSNNKDDRIMEIMVENLVYDYIQKGLKSFNGEYYLDAYASFTQALKYDYQNTAVLFYQTYALYLGTMNDRADDVRLGLIIEGIRELNKRNYQTDELLGFTEEEMRQKVSEIEYTIEERQKQEGRAEL